MGPSSSSSQSPSSSTSWRASRKGEKMWRGEEEKEGLPDEGRCSKNCCRSENTRTDIQGSCNIFSIESWIPSPLSFETY